MTVRLQCWKYAKRKSGYAPVKLTYSRDGKYFKHNTGFYCKPKDWDERNEVIIGAGRENDEMHTMRANMERLVRDYRMTHNVNPPVDYVKEHWAPGNRPNVFNDYINDFINSKRAIVSREAMKDYISFQNAYNDFEKRENKSYNIDSFNRQIFERFHNYLLSVRGLNNNTCFNRIQTFKNILNYYGHDTINYRVRKYSPKTITLSDYELDLIRTATPRDKKLERVRDLFLLGCFTGLRHGDLYKLQPSYFYHYGDRTFIELRTNKTKDNVHCPLNNIAMDIVKKYDYNPPKISNQKFNKYIKELLSSFQHFNDTVEHKTVLRGQREEMIRGPKYKFVGTHTMRRTFITRCLQNLIPPATVAYWTGLNIQTMYSYLDPAYNAQSYEDMLDL